MKRVLICFLFLATVGEVGAVTYTVCSSGCNFTAIQEAVDAAGSGDSIEVWKGIYTENVDVNKQLNIYAREGDTVVVGAGSTPDHVFEVTANNTSISGITVTGATQPYAGIYLYGANYCSISENNVSENYNGIHLNRSSNNNIGKNKVRANYYGIRMDTKSNNNTVINNDISSNYYGILQSYSRGNVIASNNIISNNIHGIYLYRSNSNVIANNNASNGYVGIYLYFSNNNIILNNTASLNSYDIYLYSSSNNKLMDNIAYKISGERGVWEVVAAWIKMLTFLAFLPYSLLFI